MRMQKCGLVLSFALAVLVGMLGSGVAAQEPDQGKKVTMTEGPLGIPLPKEKRTQAAQVLQDELHDLIDLHLKAKQLHWNVVGARFRPLHLQLDEIAEIAQHGTDMVAERMLTLGASPDGRAQAVAAQSQLEPVPTGLVKDHQVVDLTAKLLETQSKRLHQHIQDLNDIDLVSQDILIELAQKIDKQLWMIQAQQY